MKKLNEHEAAEKINRAALDLLKDPGIKLEHDEICKMLLDEGAKEGASANVIQIPQELLEEKLALCPRQFLFADKEGKGRWVSAKCEADIWSVPGLKMHENKQNKNLVQHFDTFLYQNLLSPMQYLPWLF